MYEPIVRASRDLALTDVRFATDLYYQIQEYRKATANQKRESESAQEPGSLIDWTLDSMGTIEKSIKASLSKFSDGSEVGRWATSLTGIGPVLSAGLLAHIDIERAPTAGHIWSFAGLDPSKRWEKGKKRPWNARLKTLCWKIGDSFVKFSNHEECFYGHFYRERKAIEVSRNESDEYAEIARLTLEERTFKNKAVRAVYEGGKLPDGRIDLRARRWAVKLFLAHWHHVAYEVWRGEPPPRPYVLAQQGHAHYIAPPNWPMA